MTKELDRIYAKYDKARDKIYAKERMDKDAALVFVLVALVLLPILCRILDSI